MASAVAQRRIMRDVQTVVETHAADLATHGIYYFPNETNICEGTALLIGQKGTPYFGGFFFFAVAFPADYPFAPIKVISLTQDGKTRFNPNMYVNGKVCLSILNTWHEGPQWSGIQTLESVLLSIMTDVMHDNPLINEPAYRGCGGSTEAAAYCRMIFHANLKLLTAMRTLPPQFAVPALALVETEYAKRRDELVLEAQKLAAEWDGKTETCRPFSMTTTYGFTELAAVL
jgi:ubiquitin-protein ligase